MKNTIMKFMALYLLFTFALSFISCEKEDAEIEITEIIEKAQKIAISNFSVDVSGTPYEKNNPWLVYNKFIRNKDLTSLLLDTSRKLDTLENNSSAIGELKDSLTIKESSHIKLIHDYKSIYKEKNDYYLVRLNQPVKLEKGIYSTFIWINANKWRSGFHVYVEFRIEGRKAKVIHIQDSTMSNVLESSEQ